MPIYEFQLVGGEELAEKFYTVKDMPEVGTIVNIDGRDFRRIFSTTPPMMTPVWKPYAGHSLPDLSDTGLNLKRDADGIQHVETQEQERNICSMLNRKRD